MSSIVSIHACKAITSICFFIRTRKRCTFNLFFTLTCTASNQPLKLKDKFRIAILAATRFKRLRIRRLSSTLNDHELYAATNALFFIRTRKRCTFNLFFTLTCTASNQPLKLKDKFRIAILAATRFKRLRIRRLSFSLKTHASNAATNVVFLMRTIHRCIFNRLLFCSCIY